MSKKGYFDIHWPLDHKLLTLGQIWWKIVTGPSQELSNAFLGFFLAVIVLEIMTGFPKKNRIFGKFYLWWPLVTLLLTWAKTTDVTSTGLVESFRLFFFRVFLALLVFELGGASEVPATMANVAQTATRSVVNKIRHTGLTRHGRRDEAAQHRRPLVNRTSSSRDPSLSKVWPRPAAHSDF